MAIQVGDPGNNINAAQLKSLRDAIGAVSVIASGSPNQTLRDADVPANQAMAFPTLITIPGGMLNPTSKLRLTHGMSFTGTIPGRDILVRIGQAATATFATASWIGGQAALSNHVSGIWTTHIFMAGSLTSQRCTPAYGASFGAGANFWVVTAIDFGLDVNIWIGVKFPTQGSGDTAQLLDYMLELVP